MLPFLTGSKLPLQPLPVTYDSWRSRCKARLSNECCIKKHFSKWWICSSNVHPMPHPGACSSYKSWKRIGSRFAFLCRLVCLDFIKPVHRMLYIRSRHLLVLALLRSRNAAKLGIVVSCVAQTCLSNIIATTVFCIGSSNTCNDTAPSKHDLGRGKANAVHFWLQRK